MADENGNIDVEKLAEFKPTMELRYLSTIMTISSETCITESEHRILQQKWINELNEEQWRDIPLVENK